MLITCDTAFLDSGKIRAQNNIPTDVLYHLCEYLSDEPFWVSTSLVLVKRALIEL